MLFRSKGYADRVAAMPTLPRNVATTLGTDSNAHVARLVLKLSPVLTDTDLAEYELAADALAGSVFRMLRQGQRVVFDLDDQGCATRLRLGSEAYRVVASFLPGPNVTVAERLERVTMHTLDLTKGAVLEKDCVYIIPLLEGVAFKKRISALANPKSSTGRLDVFARVITDRGTEFDRIPERYHGPLYVEVCPRA